AHLTVVPIAKCAFGGSGSARTVTVTPAPDQNGTATITVTVNDADGGTASTTFVLTVTAVNDPPVAQNDTYTTVQGTTLTVATADGVLKNDTDVDGDTLTAAVVAGPPHGTLTL